jgi:hypothetical protein
MRRLITLLLALYALSGQIAFAGDDEEIALFSASGKAEAYIALDDELTIYLWSGKPVAYLEKDSDGGYHVYGFNGKHLGWFARGVIWDGAGGGACATKEAMRSTQLEPFKGFKQFKPFKSFTQFAPFRPRFLDSFGDTPCRFLLAEGSK